MGLNPEWARPELMIITILPIPPPPVRPAVLIDSFFIGEDDLTHQLSDIIKVCIVIFLFSLVQLCYFLIYYKRQIMN